MSDPLDSSLLFTLPKEDLVSLVYELTGQVHAQESHMGILRSEIEALKSRILDLESNRNKDSHNSSKPPSSDGLSKKPCPKSLRQKGSKPSGGQPGHPGKTLHLSEAPTRTLLHPPVACQKCGHCLAGVAPCGSERRQVFDLPQITFDITEHLVQHKSCPGCGELSRGSFPDEVTQPVQYGPRVKSFLVYLTHYQLLPWDRSTQILSDLCGFSPSEGVLQSALQQCTQTLKPITQLIKDGVIAAGKAHFDETGLRAAGSLHWMHVASNEILTYYQCHKKRGQAAMDDIGILPVFGGRAVHDGLASYFAYGCGHQLCNGHHLRELIFLLEQHKQIWAQDMITLLLSIKMRVETARQMGLTALNPLELARFERRYSEIVAAGYAGNPEVKPTGKRGRTAQSKGRNLVNRLDQNRAAVLAFMKDFDSPFDNNLAERDLRMIKVRQKISGAFRTIQGADIFAQIRGYISTMRKQGHNPLDVLETVFQGRPRAPVC
jgi:transposase